MKKIEENKKISYELFTKYLEIKSDLITDLRDVFLRANYFRRKYRGNRLTDINVGIEINEFGDQYLQIYLRHKEFYIKDVIVFSNREGLKSSTIKSNLYE